MEVEVILFDWGGTLAEVVRQEGALRQGALRAADILFGAHNRGAIQRLAELTVRAEAEAGADPEHREADLAELLQEWALSLNGQADAECLALAADALCQAWVGSLDPIPGAREALSELRDRGCRMGLVSNCWIPPGYASQELKDHGFADLLDFAVFSSGVGYRKPSPFIYEQGLREAYPNGRPSDLSRVLFVGDSPVFDVMIPGQMGMKTALVSSNEGLWSEADHAKADPDLRIDGVSELPALLRSY